MGARKKEALERFNRDNIISAAKDLFERRGVEETTMDDIAREADYSKSTIYVYFRSKEDIYNSIISDYMSILIQEIELSLAKGAGFHESFLFLCDCLTSFHENNPKYYTSLILQEKSTNSRKKEEAVAKDPMDQRLEAALVALLERGVKEKKIAGKSDLSETALYLWSGVSGIILVADRSAAAIEKRYGSKRAYLDFCFARFFTSLTRG